MNTSVLAQADALLEPYYLNILQSGSEGCNYKQMLLLHDEILPDFHDLFTRAPFKPVNPEYHGLELAMAGLFILHEQSFAAYLDLMKNVTPYGLQSFQGLSALWTLQHSIQDDHNYVVCNQQIYTKSTDIPATLKANYGFEGLTPAGLLALVTDALSPQQDAGYAP